MKQITFDRERLVAREQHERAQEVELLSQLQSEQARLNALADQIDSLDRQLQQGQPTAGRGANQR